MNREEKIKAIIREHSWGPSLGGYEQGKIIEREHNQALVRAVRAAYRAGREEAKRG